MAEQELDLLQVAAIFAAELRACPAQIVGAEVLDPDRVRGFPHHGPDSPVAHGTPLPSGLIESRGKPVTPRSLSAPFHLCEVRATKGKF